MMIILLSLHGHIVLRPEYLMAITITLKLYNN